MKLIIDISDDVYEALNHQYIIVSGARGGKSITNKLLLAVSKGIPFVEKEKKSSTDFYERMVEELRELRNRIDKLNNFTETDLFLTLSIQERVWMNEQLNAMKWYYSSLKNRVLFYRDKEVLNDTDRGENHPEKA